MASPVPEHLSVQRLIRRYEQEPAIPLAVRRMQKNVVASALPDAAPQPLTIMHRRRASAPPVLAHLGVWTIRSD